MEKAGSGARLRYIYGEAPGYYADSYIYIFNLLSVGSSFFAETTIRDQVTSLQ